MSFDIQDTEQTELTRSGQKAVIASEMLSTFVCKRVYSVIYLLFKTIYISEIPVNRSARSCLATRL